MCMAKTANPWDASDNLGNMACFNLDRWPLGDQYFSPLATVRSVDLDIAVSTRLVMLPMSSTRGNVPVFQ